MFTLLIRVYLFTLFIRVHLFTLFISVYVFTLTLFIRMYLFTITRETLKHEPSKIKSVGGLHNVRSRSGTSFVRIDCFEVRTVNLSSLIKGSVPHYWGVIFVSRISYLHQSRSSVSNGIIFRLHCHMNISRLSQK